MSLNQAINIRLYANMICANCKYYKIKPASSIYMDGTSDEQGSCMYLVNGIKIRGMKKPNDSCEDFEKGEYI